MVIVLLDIKWFDKKKRVAQFYIAFTLHRQHTKNLKKEIFLFNLKQKLKI